VKKYTDLRRDVRATTRTGYKTVMNFLEKDPLGSWMIDNVRTSDAKRWFISLQESGKGYSTIHTIRGVLRPAFQLAVEDDLIVKNPFDFELSQVIVNDSVKREALSRKDERRFLDFIKHDRHFSRYYDGVYILFRTGLRISEFCGLTMQDIDFDEKTIRIDHQLQRTSDMRYSIVPTKTNAGTRVIPMTPDVEKCFGRIVNKRMNKPRREYAIDGRKGFLFFDKNGRPMVAMHWEKYFQHMVEKFNKIYLDQLPEITPHVCRHTYCSDMAKAGISPKTLQYLMGHSEIGVTMNTYTHFGLEEAQREIDAIG
ncbi:MAG: site-specific integrase, partial [Oscillospiraceae bacterium]|nr:site-specific integrase [Oscillospiraceae bacterium]